MNLYGPAKEATVWAYRDPQGDAGDDGGERSDPSPESSPDRVARRARTTLRRFVKTHKLGTIITLTYADQHSDRRRLYTDMARFERAFNACYPTRPWLWVIETHKSGRYHVHFVTEGHYTDERRTRHLAALWGQGFVDAGKSGSPDKAASYAAKYVTKDIAERPPGAHSYETRQGFRVEPLELVFDTLEDAVDALVAVFGVGPSYVWSTDRLTDYRGPPTWVFFH